MSFVTVTINQEFVFIIYQQSVADIEQENYRSGNFGLIPGKKETRLQWKQMTPFPYQPNSPFELFKLNLTYAENKNK